LCTRKRPFEQCIETRLHFPDPSALALIDGRRCVSLCTVAVYPGLLAHFPFYTHPPSTCACACACLCCTHPLAPSARRFHFRNLLPEFAATGFIQPLCVPQLDPFPAAVVTSHDIVVSSCLLCCLTRLPFLLPRYFRYMIRLRRFRHGS
jgi:hypothetical protein